MVFSWKTALLSCSRSWQGWLEDWAQVDCHSCGLCGLCGLVDSGELTPCMAAQGSMAAWLFVTQPQKSRSITPPHKYAQIQGMGRWIPPPYVKCVKKLQETSSAMPKNCSLRILVPLVFSVTEESRTTYPLSHLKGFFMEVSPTPTQPLPVTADMCYQ